MPNEDRSDIGYMKTSNPKHIDIDLSSLCNLSCRFCHINYYNHKDASYLRYDDFLHLKPLFSGLEKVTLFSRFEPLMCPDIAKILSFCFRYPVETYFSTNGLLLNDELLHLITGNLTYLTVSVTGFSREAYLKNMKSDGFHDIVRILYRLQELKKSRGTTYPMLRISTVGMMSSLRSLTDALDFVRQLEAEEGLQVTSFRAHIPELVDELPLHHPSEFDDCVTKARLYAEKTGLKLAFQGGDILENTHATSQLGHVQCDMPLHRLSLRPNGDVYPCPVADISIGNFIKQSIIGIWNSSRMKRFRDGVNNPERMNSCCRRCTHCRHGSILSEEAVDFSHSNRYLAMNKKAGKTSELP